jgi:hypothetical protein
MVLPQTGINRKYAEFLCSTGNQIFQNFATDRVITLKPRDNSDKGDIILTIKFILMPSGEIHRSKGNISTYVLGFLPTVFFIALVVSTPLPWKRKLFALFFGFFLISCFVMLRLRVIILCCLNLPTGLGLQTDASAKESLLFWYKYFVEPISLGFSIAIILWLSVCIGKKEWQKLNGVFDKG